MSLGPLMLGIDSLSLTAEERELLLHPVVGGVILFTRNYADPVQLRALTDEIRALRQPPLLIAVDQEGGRVQRFVQGFTPLPAMRLLGHQYDLDPAVATDSARRVGWLMAAELVAAGVDLSFAPVLDLDWGVSEVIGDRAFHSSPEVVARLAGAFAAGMREAGMAATGKHYPGHGAVVADSHLALPEDHRPYGEILEDMRPYEPLIRSGLGGVMVAHVVYTQLDSSPAGFSRWWLETELRQRLGFRGVIFSDDLCMVAAEVAGGPAQRAAAALAAGCDMVLVCNDRAAAVAVVDSLADFNEPSGQLRLARLHRSRGGPEAIIDRDALRAGDSWRAARAAVARLGDRPDLELHG
jgi:beta-N-acetylhexosaminidase